MDLWTNLECSFEPLLKKFQSMRMCGNEHHSLRFGRFSSFDQVGFGVLFVSFRAWVSGTVWEYNFDDYGPNLGVVLEVKIAKNVFEFGLDFEVGNWRSERVDGTGWGPGSTGWRSPAEALELVSFRRWLGTLCSPERGRRIQ